MQYASFFSIPYSTITQSTMDRMHSDAKLRRAANILN